MAEPWELTRGLILPEWIRQRPGTRPWAWWSFDAPKWEDPWEGRFYHGTFAEPRQRVGGTGDPVFEALSYAPAFVAGVPARFLTVRDLRTELRNRMHDRPAEAFDPEDPPVYESQATYLKRLDLLVDGEEAALPDGALEPVRVLTSSRRSPAGAA